MAGGTPLRPSRWGHSQGKWGACPSAIAAPQPCSHSQQPLPGHMHACQPTHNRPGVLPLQVAAGAEEVIQGMTVVEQLQDALADTVGGLTPTAGPCLQLILHCMHLPC